MNNEKIKTEHEEQREFVRDFRREYPGVLIFAIPNGGFRSKTTAGRLKAEGVVPGIPDLFIPAWVLWVEMKREKRGVVSKDQKAVISHLEDIGHSVIIGRGRDDAMSKVSDFYRRQRPN